MHLSESGEHHFITTRIVDPAFNKIWLLQNAAEAETFAERNYKFVRTIYHAYNHLLGMFSTLTPEELAIMPQTQAFFEKLGPVKLPPSIYHTMVYPLWTGNREPLKQKATQRRDQALNDLAAMMKNAEQPSMPEDQTILFGTRAQTPQAYLVGLGGHLLERKVLATLPPAEGQSWQKDDFLHATNEEVLLWQLKSGNCPLNDYYTKPNNEGGLGWISREDQQAFAKRYQTIFGLPF